MLTQYAVMAHNQYVYTEGPRGLPFDTVFADIIRQHFAAYCAAHEGKWAAWHRAHDELADAGLWEQVDSMMPVRWIEPKYSIKEYEATGNWTIAPVDGWSVRCTLNDTVVQIAYVRKV